MQQTLSNGQISILLGIVFVSTVVLELPTGAFADLLGKKITVQLSYIVRILSLCVYLYASSFWHFVWAVFLQGLAESLESGASSALIFDSLIEDGREQEFKKINSKLLAVVQSSMVAATFIGGGLGWMDIR